ncbi:unnamed protein product [Lepeophtheirus salmonis]|uniref:(salmon louse) hypothetical protein n=1 Tax=Lepeophtheirus salmonis TaxID=72036 RepID=A0A7R8CGC7_LEPSM|nr:unnamed protein product [Lepeophtheirus salmonis]CAF2774922.1 unnamed protein product [Lepeophtheirus salmonis]
MFHQSERSEFFLSDVTPKAFDTMLNEENVTPEDAPAALYYPNKFNLVQLKKKYIGFIERNWSQVNVCKLYSEAKLYDVLELTPLLKVGIVSNASEVLNSQSFLDIDRSALQSILSANELDIFQAALRWTQKQEGENLRDKLGGSLFSIPFPLLSASDFVHQVVHSQLLKTEEIIDVLEWIEQPSADAKTLCKMRNNAPNGKSSLMKYKPKRKQSSFDKSHHEEDLSKTLEKANRLLDVKAALEQMTVSNKKKKKRALHIGKEDMLVGRFDDSTEASIVHAEFFNV